MESARKHAEVADPWVSLITASEILGVTRHKVQQYALAGRLRHLWAGGRLFVDRSDTERLRDELVAEKASANAEAGA